jgi:hypothetical protein
VQRMLLFLFAWSALALGAAQAVPARLPYEPPPAPEPVVPDLRGTTWTGWNDGVKADWIVLFEPDGTLNYRYGNATYRNGTWKLEGDALYYESNKKYAEFRGIFQGNVINGEAWNVTGLRWQIHLQRAPASK